MFVQAFELSHVLPLSFCRPSVLYVEWEVNTLIQSLMALRLTLYRNTTWPTICELIYAHYFHAWVCHCLKLITL